MTGIDQQQTFVDALRTQLNDGTARSEREHTLMRLALFAAQDELDAAAAATAGREREIEIAAEQDFGEHCAAAMLEDFLRAREDVLSVQSFAEAYTGSVAAGFIVSFANGSQFQIGVARLA